MIPFLLSALGVGRTVFGAVVTWLSRRSMAELGCIALGLLCAAQFIALKAEKHHSARLQTQLIKCTQGREADRDAYAKAQEGAKAKNIAHVAVKEAESKRITDETQSAYARDHAELIRLRQQAPRGAPGRAGLSQAPAPAAGADADGLHLSPDEHLQASEIELRLMHLQNWAEKQVAVDPNLTTER